VSRGAYKVYKESKPSSEGETEGTSSKTNGKEGNGSSQNRVHEHHGVGSKKPSEGVELAPGFRDFETTVISGLAGVEQKDDGRGRGHSR
jgi:hypothetical protein